jgi:1-acyl-sn-glycerol-3-phosphate acyltransferase
MSLDSVVSGVARHGAAPLLRALYRPRVLGAEHLPAAGGVILACNHLSFCDSVLLPVVVPRPVAFIGKVEYFRARRPQGQDSRAERGDWGGGRATGGGLIGAFMRAMGTVPVDRAGGRAAAAAMGTSERVLREGRVFAIYPEGTRSPDGRLYRGRTGVARLALATGAPVVPCAVTGTDRVQPPGARLPRPPWRSGRPTLRFGPPVAIGPRPPRPNDAAVLRAVTDAVMAAIAELSGQECVDAYAPGRAAAA